MIAAKIGAILICLAILVVWAGKCTKRNRKYFCYVAFCMAAFVGFIDVPLYEKGVEYTVTAFVQMAVPYPLSLLVLAFCVFTTGVIFGFKAMTQFLMGSIAGHLFW